MKDFPKKTTVPPDSNRWTPEQFNQYMANKKQKRPNKFNAEPTVVDGIRFDSKKEAAYYGTLQVRKRCGEITEILIHKKFKLAVNGVHICDYEADFVITLASGKVQVLDVKGAATEGLPIFRMKKALMMAVHGIEVIIC
jgi:hypothetical protein